MRFRPSVWVVWAVCLSKGVALAGKPMPKGESDNILPGLEMIRKVVGRDGSLANRELVLYMPQNPDISEALLKLPDLRSKPLILVQLGSGIDGTQWVENQPVEVLNGAHLVHVVIFVDDPRPFLREVASDLRWNPKFLLLASISHENAKNILTDNVFSHIERLALICLLSSYARIGLYTYYPLPETQKLKIVKNGMENLFEDRFPSFKGNTLHLSTWFDDYPYLYQSKTGPEGEGDGVAVEILNALSRAFHYNYTLTTEPPDLQWGSFENGSWTGMLGMVHRRDKNFTVNSMTLTDDRVAALDASRPYWNEGFGLTLIAPPPHPRWHAVYYPFHILVWAAIVASLIVLAVLMVLQDGAVDGGIVDGVGDVWSYLVRPVVSHSLPRLPTAQWQRVFVATWVLACLILTTAYKANLIAFLTIPLFPERIRTLEQLANSKFRVTMSDYGDFVDGALLASESPVYRALGKKLDLFSGYDHVIHLMATGSHAFLDLYSYNIITVAAEYKIRNVYMLGEQLYPGHLCWYFQKNTPWKYKFDHGIQRLVEAGLIAHWLKIKTSELLGGKGLGVEDSSSLQPLALDHLQAAFFIILFVLSFSVLVFLIEILYHKLCARRLTDIADS